jgi:hypothetical protein
MLDDTRAITICARLGLDARNWRPVLRDRQNALLHA